jgi:protein ImuB
MAGETRRQEDGHLIETADAVASGATRLARRIGQATWMPPAPAGRAARPDPARPPVAVVGRQGSALRLVAVDEVAEARGLAAGLGLADARAMVPDLMVAEADPPGDQALLERIADWCDRYTPLVALDPVAFGMAGPDGLFLEIGGSAHLFGGEAALAADLAARIAAQGFAVRIGIAAHVGAAWAVARFGGAPIRILAPGTEAAALAPLPLAALRLPAATVAALDRLGLKTVGAVADLPRAPLARRFGVDLVRRFDQAFGRADEPIVPRRPVPALTAERRFAEPILAVDDVARVIRSLAGHLADPLEARQEGARALELALFRVDGQVTRLTVGASRPLRDPALVLGLFAEKLKRMGETIDFGFGIETVRLAVTASDRDDPAQIDLAGSAEASADLAHLVDRLGARLGLGRVRRAVPEETHIPEAAAALAPAAAIGAEADAAWTAEARPEADEAVDRPLRLFERPEPIEAVAAVPEGPPIRFRWRRATYDIARYEGPERIAAEWWRLPLAQAAAGPDDASAGPETGPAPAAAAAAPAGASAQTHSGAPSGGARPWLGAPGRATAAPPAGVAHPAAAPPGAGQPGAGPRQRVPSRTSGELHAAERLVPRGDPRSTDRPVLRGDVGPVDRPVPRGDAGAVDRPVPRGNAGPVDRAVTRGDGPPRDRPAPSPEGHAAAGGRSPEPPRDLGVAGAAGAGPDGREQEQFMNIPEALPPGTPGLTRDYFRVEDRSGRRFWVFREGLYERETARPRWYLQGLFA